MKRKSILGAMALAFAVALPAGAQAATAFTSSPVSLRAGPAVGYPRVLVLGPGSPVEVYGCLDGWSWCDVSFQDYRGWISAGYLQYPYEGRRVLLPGFGAQIGLPIISFSLGGYWGDHYRGRPWYGDRDRWEHRGPQFAPQPVYHHDDVRRQDFHEQRHEEHRDDHHDEHHDDHGHDDHGHDDHGHDDHH